MSTPQYIVQSQPVQQQQPAVQYVTQPTTGGAPVQVPPPVTSGAAYYNAGQQGGAPVVYLAPGSFNQPNYTYKPNNFFTLSVVMSVLCGMFSPLFLVFTIPALLYSQKSKQHAKSGMIDEARKAGMISAYLNLAAVIGAFIVACLVTGLVLGLYGPKYSLDRYCANNPTSYRCRNYF